MSIFAGIDYSVATSSEIESYFNKKLPKEAIYSISVEKKRHTFSISHTEDNVTHVCLKVNPILTFVNAIKGFFNALKGRQYTVIDQASVIQYMEENCNQDSAEKSIIESSKLALKIDTYVSTDGLLIETTVDDKSLITESIGLGHNINQKFTDKVVLDYNRFIFCYTLWDQYHPIIGKYDIIFDKNKNLKSSDTSKYQLTISSTFNKTLRLRTKLLDDLEKYLGITYPPNNDRTFDDREKVIIGKLIQLIKDINGSANRYKLNPSCIEQIASRMTKIDNHQINGNTGKDNQAKNINTSNHNSNTPSLHSSCIEQITSMITEIEKNDQIDDHSAKGSS